MLVTTCSNELQTDVNQNADIYICLTGIERFLCAKKRLLSKSFCEKNCFNLGISANLSIFAPKI